jgi:preprotein translocase subunit SecF
LARLPDEKPDARKSSSLQEVNMRRWFKNSYLPGLICLVLSAVLFNCSILEAKAAVSGATPRAQTEAAQSPTLRERIQEIQPGTMIEVRLHNKQKIRGRLGEVTDEGFSLTTPKGDKIGNQKVAFTEVKSLKKVEGGKGGRIALFVLAGVGVFLAIIIIGAVNGSWGGG